MLISKISIALLSCLKRRFQDLHEVFNIVRMLKWSHFCHRLLYCSGFPIFVYFIGLCVQEFVSMLLSFTTLFQQHLHELGPNTMLLTILITVLSNGVSDNVM